MTDHLLRIEAVNLGWVTSDTDQLSVIRGGGLLALKGARVPFDDPGLDGCRPAEQTEAIRPAGLWSRIIAWLGSKRHPAPVRPEPPAVEPISVGASVGLFRLRPRPPEGEGADAYRDRLVDHLCRCYPHHTFVVDLEPLPTDDDFRQAHQRLIARNRLRQLRQPTVAWPEEPDSANGAAGPCREDDLRPALTSADGGSGPLHGTSASVQARYRFGRVEKRAFLARESGITDLDYTEDLDELACKHPDRRLDNKIAVLYFDGNGFGALQSDCETPRALHAFDAAIRGRRRALLARMLEGLRTDPLALTPRRPDASSGKLRFELLLWGGDEVLFVVPAWKGLHALSLFHEATADWRWPDDPDGRALTHAGAVIFCNHKTPIDRVASLAREMAEGIKERDGGRDANLYDYLILESLDFPSEPIERHWRRRYGTLGKPSRRRPLALPEAGGSIIAEVERLAAVRNAERLPHGKLHEGIYGLIDESAEPERGLEGALKTLDRTLDRSADASAEPERSREDLAALRAARDALFPGQEPAWAWLHLMELWDYLGPRPESDPPGVRR